MKSKEKSPIARPWTRLMLESLCDGMDELWHIVDGERVVNVYELHKTLKRWAGSKRVPSQSTLARLYGGETEHFSRPTAQILSDFFSMPIAVITGDLEITSEAWGMDVTNSEIRWIMLLRKLTPDQRTAIYRSIRAMLPPDTPSPHLPPGASPLLPKH